MDEAPNDHLHPDIEDRRFNERPSLRELMYGYTPGEEYTLEDRLYADTARNIWASEGIRKEDLKNPLSKQLGIDALKGAKSGTALGRVHSFRFMGNPEMADGIPDALDRVIDPATGQPVVVNRPFGELSAAPRPSPTQWLGNRLQDVLEAAGAAPHVARHLAEGLGGVAGFSPLGIIGAGADAIDAKARGNTGGVAMAMAGMLPGAGKAGRKVAEEVGAAARDVASNLRVPRWPEGTKPTLPLTEWDMIGNSRVEDVPLSKVFSGQADRDMRWGTNAKGEYGETQIPGYGDRPVAVRMPDGTYHLKDGNHRTAIAMQRGDETMPMHVIDHDAFDSGVERPVPPLGTPTFKYAEHYPDSKIVHVDTAKLDQAWQRDPLYVGELGAGKTTDAQKYMRAKSYFHSGPESFEAPEISINAKGLPSFVDGRHRFAAMRDMGYESVPMVMDPEAAANARKYGLLSETANPGIRAYHGSPHDFDRFSMDKIGTGEGAQAFGHGMYFADNERVAKSYRDTLQGKGFKIPEDVDSLPSEQRAAILQAANAHGANPDPMQAAKRAQWANVELRSVPREEIADKIARSRPPAGKIYEVSINADPAHFLDWDKPLPVDSPLRQKVMDAAREALTSDNPQIRNAAKDAFLSAQKPEMTGAGVHNSLSTLLGGKEPATQALNQAGIPGIKYLDQGSRTAGEGSRNYVVFDDNLINIVKKYGLAGISMLPPATAAFLSQRMTPVQHNPFAAGGNPALTPIEHNPWEENGT